MQLFGFGVTEFSTARCGSILLCTWDKHVLKSTDAGLTSLSVMLQLGLGNFYLVMLQQGCPK